MNDEAVIRIGTRGSMLARWQADHVAAAIEALPGSPRTEQVLIRTEGDRVQDVPLWKVDGKAFFTKEIEDALLERRIDVAVHSLKDLATSMPPELMLAAVMAREDHRDVLVFSPRVRAASSASGPVDPDSLPQGAVVGTSSLRRRAFLLRWRKDLQLKELRGNVPTRLAKVDAEEYDAVILAAAGVKRLGLGSRISAYLPPESFLPAVSQGALGLQVRSDDHRTAEWIGQLEDGAARAATNAERAFLRRMEGGCQVPVGALAEVGTDGMVLRGMVASLNGAESVDGEISGPVKEAEGLGSELGARLLAEGAASILGEIRRAAADE